MTRYANLPLLSLASLMLCVSTSVFATEVVAKPATPTELLL